MILQASFIMPGWLSWGGGTLIRLIWHVDRAWKQEPWAKVKESEMAADIFKMLRIELLCKLEECLASISTEFSNYFEREWLRKKYNQNPDLQLTKTFKAVVLLFNQEKEET